MTSVNWVGQLALNEVFKRGVDLAIYDPMAAPLLARCEGVKISWGRRCYRFRTIDGGVFVVPPESGRRRPAKLSVLRNRPRLSVAQTPAGAKEQALSRWGTRADFLFDGEALQASMPTAAPITRTFHANMSKLLETDPPALAKLVPFGEIQVLVTGEPVVWIDALHCARTLSRECARRVAMARRLDLSDNPDVVIAIPTGRVHLQFHDRVGKLTFQTSCASSITRLAANVIEIATEPAAIGVVDMNVGSASAVLQRVGIVLPLGHSRPGLETADPLERFADLLNVEDA